MKQKQLYTAPEAETLVVRFEANIMSPNAFKSGGAGDYSYDEINDNDDY